MFNIINKRYEYTAWFIGNIIQSKIKIKIVLMKPMRYIIIKTQNQFYCYESLR